MLTADLIDVRKKDGELFTRNLDASGRAEAVALAEACLEAARTSVGARREELEAAWGAAGSDAKRPKLAGAIRKLVEDACTFEGEPTDAPVELRHVLFSRASEARRTSESGLADRDALVRALAEERGLSPDELERALFADLRGEHLLKEAPTLSAESIVEAYELGQAQAILLRAVRVTCEVRDFSPGALRAFFAKLKFHKLLFTAERTDDGGFRVFVDGPFSMFDAVTRYGLRLALLLPALRALESWSLVADVRWGHAREPLVFRLASKPAKAKPAGAKRERRKGADVAKVEPKVEVHLADDVRALLDDLRKIAAGFDVRAATELLDVPGFGVCIPDLTLVSSDGGPPVHVEVLGFWSRDAVFRRIELVNRGMRARVVFAASARLRVSEELLDDDGAASLYVYKGKMNARALLERITRVGRVRHGASVP